MSDLNERVESMTCLTTPSSGKFGKVSKVGKVRIATGTS